MNASKLTAATQTIQDILSSDQPLDERTRNQLQKVAKDLESAASSGPDETPPPRSVRQQLREILTDLETKHPHIADIIQQLDDVLAGIGI